MKIIKTGLLLFIITLIPSIALCTAYVSNQNGNWSTVTIWTPNGTPGNGDTVSITHVVTVDVNTIIGTSPSDTTTDVLTVTGGGVLTADTDISLTVRGNSLFDVGSSGNTIDALILNAGSSVLYDPSQATTTSTEYTIKFAQYTTWRINGLIGNKCTFGSIPGFGFAKLALTNASYGACVTAVYCDFQNLSDYPQKAAAAGRATEINIQNCTFSSVTGIFIGPNIAGGKLVFRNNHIDENAGPVQFIAKDGQNNTCETVGNILLSDVIYNTPAGYTITGNYYADVPSTNGVNLIGELAETVSGNFIINPGSGANNWDSNMTDTILFDNANASNPTFLNLLASSADTVFTGLIIDCNNDAFQGDYLFPKSTGGFKNTVSFSLLLPNAVGKSSAKIISDAFMAADTLCDSINNTYCTFDAGGSQQETSFGIGESGNAYAGYAPDHKNNIAWTYPGIGLTGGFLVVRQQSIVQDIITATDYNWGWGLSAGSEGGGYHAWEDYQATSMFTYTPNLNGGSGDPQFLDYTRNVAKYDIEGLGNSASTTWATGQAYVVGDLRSAQSTGYYFDTIINYRCINDHTSLTGDATDGKPGVAGSWRDNWEFTTLFRLREDVSRIATLITWIKEGFAPSNQSLKGAGEGGVDIGAVAVAAAPSVSGGGGISVGRITGFPGGIIVGRHTGF